MNRWFMVMLCKLYGHMWVRVDNTRKGCKRCRIIVYNT